MIKRGDSLYIFAFAYNMSKIACDVMILLPSTRISGNPRAWTSVPGRFPSFLQYLNYRDKRVAAPQTGTLANLAVPLTCAD